MTPGTGPARAPRLAAPLWVAVLALLLVTAACGSTSGSIDGASEPVAPPQAETSSEPQPTDQSIPATTPQPDPILVATAGGGQLDWNSLQGQDVVLWFWAPW